MVERRYVYYLVSYVRLLIVRMHVLPSIKDYFGCLFGAYWLFVITNLLMPSLHTLLVVSIMKPSGGGNYMFDRHHHAADSLTNRT